MLKRKPSLEHVGVFGCDAYYSIPKGQRDVFGPKMVPCIYLGHDGVQNCAIVYDLLTEKDVRTRDVEYRENRFTHAAALVAGGDRVQDVLAAGYSKDDSPAAAPPMPEVDFNEQDVDESSGLDVKEVERILAKRTRDGRLEYHVQWAGEQEATWEPAGHVELGARHAIDQFEEQAAAVPPPQGVEAGAEPAPAQQQPTTAAGLGASSEQRAAPAPVGASASAAPAAAGAPETAQVKRRSPRMNLSSVALDAADGHQVPMAMSAISGMQDCEPAESWSFLDSDVVCAVTAGLSVLEDQTPATYREAMASPDKDKWKAAMDKEMAAMEEMKVWELVPRSSVPKGAGQTVLPVKFVFKIKTDETGAVTSYKARLTPKGFMQREGVNFFDTYARTGMYKSMRVGLSLAAKWDHELDQMDVPSAFLNADIDEELYMELPEGYREGREHLVCRIRKALYGLKQAPREWYLMVSKYIMEVLGFKATVSDPCLFYKRSGTGRLLLLFLFVDDFQVSYHRDDKAEWDELKGKLIQRFQTKDMGPSTWILGMHITRNRAQRTITLDQELYVTKALERYGLQECKPCSTPEATGHAEAESPALGKADHHLFQEIVGTEMYAAISCRPDISHAVHSLASAMQAPTEWHLVAAKRVLRYLSGTKEVGLVFGSRNGSEAGESRGHQAQLQVDVCAFADADWANDKADRKSITGWVAKVSGDPVSWTSKKQRTVAQSTCEAELYAEAAAVQEVLWLRGLMKELGLHCSMGSVVHGDNQSTIALSKNGVRSERTKHVDVKYHFVTETVEAGTVQLKWIPTTEQQADIFTKALAAPVFECLRKQLMTR